MKKSGKEHLKSTIYESTRASIFIKGDARRQVDNRFPVYVFDTIRFTANDKDFSLPLEMTTQESAVPHSLEAPNPQPLIPSH